MGAAVDVDGKGWYVGARRLIMIHTPVATEYVPTIIVDAITRLAATHTCKLERAVYIGVFVGEVNP